MSTNQEPVFNRSRNGLNKKFEEALTILEYSIIMVEFFEVKEFNNVIAGQLRLLLHDMNQGRDNALLIKVSANPTLYPIKSSNFTYFDDGVSGTIIGEYFDYSKPKIPLNRWLKQIIFKLKMGNRMHNMTIKDFIKFYANKSGGAHVDSSLQGVSFLVEVHSDKVMTEIANGFLKSIGRDLADSHKKHFEVIINKLGDVLSRAND